MDQKPLPYVTAALLCERVLQEADGTVSIIRIADRLQYRVEGLPMQGLPPDTKPIVNVQGLVSLKSGPIVGDHTIKVAVQRPSGERKYIHSQPVKFLGKDHGANLILTLGLGIEQDGLYWFDVFFDDVLLTQIPLVVTPLPKQEPVQPPHP